MPTAEILPARKWSVSGYRVNFDDNQGFTDVSNWPVTFAFGVEDRAELFGSLVVVNRIDRDVRPLFLATASSDGARREPAGRRLRRRRIRSRAERGAATTSATSGSAARSTCSPSGASSPRRSRSARMVKVPTGDTESGASTGKTDFAFDAIVSKDLNARVELSGYAGFIVRGEPDEVEETNGVRWGFGAGFPSRTSLRFTAEIDGEAYTNESLLTKVLLLGEDGSFAPAGFAYDMKSPVNVNLGLTWQHRNGFFAGAGWTWRAEHATRATSSSATSTNGAGDRMDIVGRIGYHPGVRVYVPPPPPPAAAGAAACRGRTVRRRCARAASPARCSSGKTSTVSAGRAGSGRRCADLRVERAGRFADERLRATDAVDGADGRRARAGDRDA